MSTLLERAKALPAGEKRGRRTTDSFEQRLDLALAYVAREVSASQTRQALGYSTTSNLPNAMGATIVSAVRRGLIRLVDLRESGVEVKR